MNGPLSAKQHREHLKFLAQEQRENTKMEREEARKNQLHEIKLQESALKANQGIGHKEQLHEVKLKELGSPLGKPPKMNRQKLGLPTVNPMADTGMFKQGQHHLAQGTDTVPAMLTPGEAVIPAAAAQDPKNKKAIKRMVQEGRQANRKQLRDGTVNLIKTDARNPASTMGTHGGVPQQVQQAVGYADGTPVVPSLAYAHPDEPGSSYMNGSTGVQYYEGGTVNAKVPWLERFGNNPISALSDASVEGFKTLVSAPGYGLNSDLPKQDTIVLPPKQQPVPTIDASTKPAVPTSYVTTGVTDTGGTASTYSPIASEGTVAQRHNNPGNLMFVNQPGAIKGEPKSGGGFWAKFETPEAGRTALENQLILDTQKRGMTLAETMNKYAPSSDKNNTTAYIDTIAKDLGIKPTDKVPQELIGKFADTITRVESGGKYQDPRIIKTASNADPTAVPQMTALETVNSAQGLNESKAGYGLGEDARGVTGLDTKFASDSLSPERNAAYTELGSFTQENFNQIESAVQKALAAGGTKDEQKSFLERSLAAIYGPKGLFNDQDLARFVITAVGGIMTGARSGRAIQWAAQHTLKAADARQDQEFKADQQAKLFKQQMDLEEGKQQNRLDVAAMQANKDRSYQAATTAINDAVQSGAIDRKHAPMFRQALARGSYSDIYNAIDSGKYSTVQYQMGVPANADLKDFVHGNSMVPTKGFIKPEGTVVLYKNGKAVEVPITEVNQLNTNPADYQFNQIKKFADSLGPELFARDKNNKPLAGTLKGSSRETIGSQVATWAKENGNVDPNHFTDQFNRALKVAAKYEVENPEIGKLIGLSLLNTSAITDYNKITDKDGKMVNPGKIGDFVDTVKKYAPDSLGNTTVRKGENPATVFMEKVTNDFDNSKNKVSRDDMLNNISRTNKFYDKIKEAPNDYYAYVFYQLAVNSKK